MPPSRSGVRAIPEGPLVRLIRTLTAVCAALLLCGCVAGNKYSYASTTADVAYQGSGKVSILAVDERSYVRSGDKPATFVGLQRNRFGIPFDVNTASAQPLAEDMAQALAQSLAAAGYQAAPLPAKAWETTAAGQARLLQGAPQRALLLTIKEWKTDTKRNTALTYDLTLRAYGGLRQTGGKALRGSEDIDGSFLAPLQHTRQAVPEVFRQKVGALLNAPEIRQALK